MRWALTLSLLAFAGCFSEPADSGGSDGTCQPGESGCPCANGACSEPDASCNADIDICVPNDCSPGQAGCECGPGQQCDDGLTCTEGLCLGTPPNPTGGATGPSPSTGDTGAPMTTATDTTTTDTGADTTTGAASCEPCPTGHCDLDGNCARYVFVTGPTHAAIGGLQGANDRCLDAAHNAGLPDDRDYRALLATNNEQLGAAWNRLQLESIPDATFVLPGDDVPVVATSPAQLRADVAPPALMTEINRDAEGNEVDGSATTACSFNAVWTGMLRDPPGADVASIGATCQNWTSDAMAEVGGAGSIAQTDVVWVARNNNCSCNETAYLYCFELSPPP